MATVLIGAALSGFAAAGAVGTGTFLGMTAIQVGFMAAAIGGVATHASGIGNTPDSPAAQQRVEAPGSQLSQISDKTTVQQAQQLSEAQIGEDESKKRKRKSAKSKFKIKKDLGVADPADSGVSIDNKTKTKPTGVQI